MVDITLNIQFIVKLNILMYFPSLKTPILIYHTHFVWEFQIIMLCQRKKILKIVRHIKIGALKGKQLHDVFSFAINLKLN